MLDIACLGILVADLLGRPIDDLPPRGRLGLVDEMTLHIGGCASNTAIILARLGIRTGVFGKIGADGLGDFISATLDRSGVDTVGLVRDAGVGTSASMVLVSTDGERTFLHHIGGNAAYREEDVDWESLAGAKILHIAGALVLPGIDGEPMARILRRAKSLGKVTTLDTVWDATGKWMATLAPCLEHTDCFLPSLSEAEALTGETYPADIALALRDRGVKVVGLKLGASGCYIQTEDSELVMPAFEVNPVDGTGSGDAWVAGFLCGLRHGWDLERTARFANAVGALCVTSMGSTSGIRSLEETEAFIRARS